MSLKVAYVAGPYRAATREGVLANILRAEAVALSLWQQRIIALCPHLNTAHFDTAGVDEALLLDGTLELMRRCDMVVLVGDGWQVSVGTRGEVAEARRLGKPVFMWQDGALTEEIFDG